uniref:Protein regulator of cytokinesis 1 n=1 Tax=Fundulus heteroclitus TaxID=8078 RepID=A0A146UR54_FUNHE
MWTSMGFVDSEYMSRGEDVVSIIGQMCAKLTAEQVTERVELEGKVSGMLERVKRLELALGVRENALLVKLDDHPILRVKEIVSQRLSELERYQRERVEKMEGVLREEHGLCEELDVSYKREEIECPTMEQIQSVRDHVEYLKKVKSERLELLERYRSDLTQLREELEDAFIGQEVGFDDGARLHPSSLSLFEKLIQEKRAVVQNNKHKSKELVQRLEYLWSLVEMPEEDQRAFLEDITHTPSDLIQLEMEVRRCEEFKKVHLSRIVKKLRSCISELWESMFFSVSMQHASLPSFFYDLCTDEVLKEHESEYRALKNKYSTYEGLYQSMNQWRSLRKAYSEFLARSADPQRFRLRGYSMVQEEKQRRKFQNQLPKLEKHVRTQIRNYEDTEGEEFIYFGVTFDDFVDSENRKDEESRKAAKQKATDETKGNTSKGVGSNSVRKKQKITSKDNVSVSSKLRTPFSPIRFEKRTPDIPRIIYTQKPCIVLESGDTAEPKPRVSYRSTAAPKLFARKLAFPPSKPMSPSHANFHAARRIRKSIGRRMFQKMKLCAMTSTPNKNNEDQFCV